VRVLVVRVENQNGAELADGRWPVASPQRVASQRAMCFDKTRFQFSRAPQLLQSPAGLVHPLEQKPQLEMRLGVVGFQLNGPPQDAGDLAVGRVLPEHGARELVLRVRVPGT
jgi:hypothetical protein